MLLACGIAQLELAPARLVEPGLLALRRDLPDDCSVYGGDNVGESGLTIERMIARSRLQPRYGSGWQPA